VKSHPASPPMARSAEPPIDPHLLPDVKSPPAFPSMARSAEPPIDPHLLPDVKSPPAPTSMARSAEPPIDPHLLPDVKSHPASPPMARSAEPPIDPHLLPDVKSHPAPLLEVTSPLFAAADGGACSAAPSLLEVRRGPVISVRSSSQLGRDTFAQAVQLTEGLVPALPGATADLVCFSLPTRMPLSLCKPLTSALALCSCATRALETKPMIVVIDAPPESVSAGKGALPKQLRRDCLPAGYAYQLMVLDENTFSARPSSVRVLYLLVRSDIATRLQDVPLPTLQPPLPPWPGPVSPPPPPQQLANTRSLDYAHGILAALRDYLDAWMSSSSAAPRIQPPDADEYYPSRPSTRCADSGCVTCNKGHTFRRFYASPSSTFKEGQGNNGSDVSVCDVRGGANTGGNSSIDTGARYVLPAVVIASWLRRRWCCASAPERRHTNGELQYCCDPTCDICNRANARAAFTGNRPSDGFHLLAKYMYRCLRRRELPLALSQGSHDLTIRVAHARVISRISATLHGFRVCATQGGAMVQAPCQTPALPFWLWGSRQRLTIRDGGRLGITYGSSQRSHHANADDAGVSTLRKSCNSMFADSIFEHLRCAEPSGEGLIPLFTVPKKVALGEPPRDRMIADLKLGGVNAMCASLPAYFRPGVMALHSVVFVDGYDAMSDFRDHFHTWPLHRLDRPFVCVAPPPGPDTFGSRLRYSSMPMGSVNAPFVSNCMTYGHQEDSLRKMPPFAGLDAVNDPYLQGFDASKPPIVRTTPEGGPAAQLSTHMDDALLSGASYGHSWHALCVYLRSSSRKGVRVSWDKLTMPRRNGSCYNGFQVRRGACASASSGAAPQPFVEYAIRRTVIADIRALIAVTLACIRVPRLTLARLAGKIQSNAPIVPSFCPFLRKIYDAFVFGDRSPEFWAESVPITKCARSNLEMVDDILASGRGRLRVFKERKSMALQWTDGSGQGTGGSAYLADLSSVSTWSADWSPCLRHFSSNMKELMSVAVAIRRQLRVFRKYGTCLLAHRLVLHYTDNVVTAGILRNGSSTNPDLLAVARCIASMSSEMGTTLTVLHVSGKRMIEQGTDGLSRDAKAGPIAAEHWRLALRPIACPVAKLLWQTRINAALDMSLMIQPQSAPPTSISGKQSLFFASPWIAASLAANILIAQNMDLRTSAIVVIPRRCQQLFSHAFRRFTLVTFIEPGDPMWAESELEPLCIYSLPIFSPPPPYTDRYLAKNAKRHRNLFRLLRENYQAERLAALREQRDRLRGFSVLQHDVPSQLLLARVDEIHKRSNFSSVQAGGPYLPPPRCSSAPLRLRDLRGQEPGGPGHPSQGHPSAAARNEAHAQYLQCTGGQHSLHDKHGLQQDSVLRGRVSSQCARESQAILADLPGGYQDRMGGSVRVDPSQQKRRPSFPLRDGLHPPSPDLRRDRARHLPRLPHALQGCSSPCVSSSFLSGSNAALPKGPRGHDGQDRAPSTCSTPGPYPRHDGHGFEYVGHRGDAALVAHASSFARSGSVRAGHSPAFPSPVPSRRSMAPPDAGFSGWSLHGPARSAAYGSPMPSAQNPNSNKDGHVLSRLDAPPRGDDPVQTHGPALVRPAHLDDLALRPLHVGTSLRLLELTRFHEQARAALLEAAPTLSSTMSVEWLPRECRPRPLAIEIVPPRRLSSAPPCGR